MSHSIVHNTLSQGDRRSLRVASSAMGPRVPLKRGTPDDFADGNPGPNAKHPKGSTLPASPPVPVPSGTRHTAAAAKSDSAAMASIVSAARRTQTEFSVRHLYREIVRARYPLYEPQNSYELFALAGASDYRRIPIGQLSAHLAKEWSKFVSIQKRDPESIEALINAVLDQPAEVTGPKPLPGDPDVQIIPLPESPYALRMWPASLSRREYCLDFVYADNTNKPSNVPQGYNLSIHVPMASLPWLGIGPQALESVERNCGVRPEDMREGAEKFILRDGLECVMEYAEEGSEARSVRFKVPIRPGGHERK
ncbi:hypothetical protein C8T65DRAFT_738607 [Cerioporus squamosus]|nr:hypothetical protein C8T65DRAFT_738607 [Cerioporus squamosus]